MVLQITHLCKRFGPLVAVSDISITVRHGELFGLVGPSGAGKSLLVRMAMGLVTPNQGVVTVAGRDVHRDAYAIRYMVGYLAQNPYIPEQITGRAYLHLIATQQGLNSTQMRIQESALLPMLGLEPYIDQTVMKYSHAVYRKVALCAALLHDPSLLILDEPFIELDNGDIQQIKAVLRNKHQHGTAILLTASSLKSDANFYDRIAILDKGQLLATGVPSVLWRKAKAGDQATLREALAKLS